MPLALWFVRKWTNSTACDSKKRPLLVRRRVASFRQSKKPRVGGESQLKMLDGAYIGWGCNVFVIYTNSPEHIAISLLMRDN